MDLPSLHRKAGEEFKRILQQELEDQGHVLSGSLIRSIEIRWDKYGFVIRARYYATYVDTKMPAKQANMSMWPRMVSYFIRRGHPRKVAQLMARVTILRWMKTGRPTPTSVAYSRNGHRLNFVQRSIDKSNMDQAYNIRLRDWFLDEVTGKIKSERV